ncbi:putative RDD family membrane protein YckC [Luteibacter sp. Sphag1AF]|uniref:RDD family protein n=1 Tax=Luteibacter sp. Sphag1AF TaxID=2587031 RepID=UPI00161910B8|nr:RDD family protein [Luteibacter sp. Sphag1AF]MBB3228014.1 putative RDD family membrane protein YckC [Luteibacter sp. Sphag1AF]
MTKQVWIGRDGERLGPYTEDEVRAGLRRATYHPHELGWYEGLADWAPLSQLFPGVTFIPDVNEATPPPVPPPFLGVTDEAQPEYAGFWLRFAAWFIDCLILLVPFALILLSFGWPTALNEFTVNFRTNQTVAMTNYMMAMQSPAVVCALCAYLYYVGFEASRLQATPGKLAVGLRVTDLYGERISIQRSFARNAVRLISIPNIGVLNLLQLVSYLMTGWTARKQGLHDMLAGTLVLRGRASEAPVREGTPPPAKGGSFNA